MKWDKQLNAIKLISKRSCSCTSVVELLSYSAVGLWFGMSGHSHWDFPRYFINHTRQMTGLCLHIRPLPATSLIYPGQSIRCLNTANYFNFKIATMKTLLVFLYVKLPCFQVCWLNSNSLEENKSELLLFLFRITFHLNRLVSHSAFLFKPTTRLVYFTQNGTLSLLHQYAIISWKSCYLSVFKRFKNWHTHNPFPRMTLRRLLELLKIFIVEKTYLRFSRYSRPVTSCISFLRNRDDRLLIVWNRDVFSIRIVLMSF